MWSDQSGQGNHARSLDQTLFPKVIADGVQLNYPELGAGFVVANSSSLDFGSSDFAVLVVAGLPAVEYPITLFRKSDNLRTGSRQVAIDWVLSSPTTGQPQGTIDDTVISSDSDIQQPAVNAYGLYRSTSYVELHVNGGVRGTAELPSAGLVTSNADDLYLGVGSATGVPADSIEAVIAIRGSVGSTELSQLEGFLRSTFAK
jgi:hypothetical protein